MFFFFFSFSVVSYHAVCFCCAITWYGCCLWLNMIWLLFCRVTSYPAVPLYFFNLIFIAIRIFLFFIFSCHLFAFILSMWFYLYHFVQVLVGLFLFFYFFGLVVFGLFNFGSIYRVPSYLYLSVLLLMVPICLCFNFF